MKKIMIALTAAVVSVTSSAVPSFAAPLGLNAVSTPQSNVEQVRAPRGYYYRGGRHYYNGHRGYNYYRPGYRRYNGWWYPAGAFAAGALIGGAIGGAVASPPPARYVVPSGNAHIRWCAANYRSYRAYDNTYQPYNGPRRQCVSPY
ncbi:BA14K family protein [Ancylobacter pratisalsi]|uniref:Lectin-like protein BA14k n=1 Tax=Ancylobacter pratisalsi TaxID=1745854 RepID=A0A6P1YHP0_9HYPH|nr:BA14K family protein [Ancylobacter pratisalsi]QIB32827.1 BA14K family protein [Ancylobacter pratisalsi]